MTRATAVAAAGALLMTELCVAQRRADSVCDILGRLGDFTGEMVQVRTRVSSDVGDWLIAEKDCPVRIKAGRVTMDNSIAVFFPDDPIVKLSQLAVPFQTDRTSRRLLEAAVNRPHVRIDATVEGLIVTRHPPTALVNEKNPDVALGFGHMGWAPAAIIVKRLSDVKVTYRRNDGTYEVVPISPAP